MDIKGLLINVVNTRLDANFEARRPAVQAAKEKQRNKQAEKIYKMRQEGDYEGSIAAIDEAAFANYKEIAANNVKKAELQAKAEAAIEEKVAAKAEEVKKEAIEFVAKEKAAAAKAAE